MSIDLEKPKVYRRTGKRPATDQAPLTYEFRRSKGKSGGSLEQKPRKKYSAELEDIQQAHGDVVRIAHRTARAVYEGIDQYERALEKSAQAKKDGALKDFPQNSAKALSHSLKEVSVIPVDIADAVTRVNYRKRARRNLRRVSEAMRGLPL